MARLRGVDGVVPPVLADGKRGDPGGGAGRSIDMDAKLFHDNFQNYKKYGVPKAQLVIADIPYNIGADAYGSNPMWYNGGDRSNGESKFAKKNFFNSDGYFKIAEYMLLLPPAKA